MNLVTLRHDCGCRSESTRYEVHDRPIVIRIGVLYVQTPTLMTSCADVTSGKCPSFTNIPIFRYPRCFAWGVDVYQVHTLTHTQRKVKSRKFNDMYLCCILEASFSKFIWLDQCYTESVYLKPFFTHPLIVRTWNSYYAMHDIIYAA